MSFMKSDIFNSPSSIETGDLYKSYYTSQNTGNTLISTGTTTGTITVTPPAGSGTTWIYNNPSGQFTYKAQEYFKIRIPKNCTLEEKVDFLMEFVSGSISNVSQNLVEDQYLKLPEKYKKFFINTNATEAEQKAVNVKESLEII